METLPKLPEEVAQTEYDESREEYIARMEYSGFLVIVPKDNELFVDIDTEDARCECYRILDIATKRGFVQSYTVYQSRNGLPGRHIYIQLYRTLTEIERIAWQGVFSSDPLRSLLSLERLDKGDILPTIFIEKSNYKEDILFSTEVSALDGLPGV